MHKSVFNCSNICNTEVWLTSYKHSADTKALSVRSINPTFRSTLWIEVSQEVFILQINPFFEEILCARPS